MLRAATQQISPLSQDQHPAHIVNTSQGPANHVDGGPVGSRSPFVPQQDQSTAPADSSPREPMTTVSADTERFQWLQSPQQDPTSVRDNTIEVRIDPISGQGDALGSYTSPTLPPAPRRQPSAHSTVAGYQGLLSSPSLDLELPDILESEPTAPEPCEAGPSHHPAPTTASASAPRHVDPSGLSDGSWPNQNLQQSSLKPADNNGPRHTMHVQAQAQTSALVTPPSTTAPDGLGIGIEVDADAPCDEVTAL